MNGLKELLSEYDQIKVEKFVDYCNYLATAKNKDGSLKNPWMGQRSAQLLAKLFKQVKDGGLWFDGDHITLQKIGVSFDYIAFKNLMFSVYPESIIDVQLVYEDDIYQFEKESGSVKYIHKISDPFKDNQEIKGAYCVIKNKRGEFLTLLSKSDIDKHRKKAKTDSIWKEWFHEMALKTIIKKACKQHFADIFQEIETLDNENYDLELPLDIDIEIKQEIEKIDTKEGLNDYYTKQKAAIKNKGLEEQFMTILTKRKDEIEDTKSPATES